MASGYKELVEELNKHRSEVSKLKNSLNELDLEKESWFRKKEEFSGRIRSSIQKIKDSKTKRDSLTQDVKELKSRRDNINKGISPKLKDFDNLKKENINLAKSFGTKESSSKIRQNIEKMEFRIETEPMSFDKEQALMKKIKELKRLYGDARSVDESNKKLNEISDEIKKMKKEANEVHKLIQDKAKQSQVLHDEILKISAEIDKMKVDEEGSFRKFLYFRKKFNEVNAQLKEKLKSMNGVKEQLDKMDFDRKEKRRLEQESFLKSKEDAVNEKFRKGQKLTTEDLLVFQKVSK